VCPVLAISWYALPDSRHDHGDLLVTRPPTPCQHESLDIDFVATLSERLQNLQNLMSMRIEWYGPDILEWRPGHEPPGVTDQLQKEQERRNCEAGREINAMSDTDDEEEQEKKYKQRLCS
jgi:hypothetical protein